MRSYTRLFLALVVAFILPVNSLAQAYYTTYSNSIDSPKDLELPPGISWAEKYPNSYKNVVSVEMETHANLGEVNSFEPNNTVQATMSKTLEDPKENNIVPQEEPLEHHLKPETPQTTMHTYHNRSYPNMGRDEIVVHRPAPVIVKRPATKVYITYPPLVVKPSPVIFHRPPPSVIQQVIYKKQPQPLKIQPMFVRVVKSTKKVMMKEELNGDTMTDKNYPEYL